MANGRKAAANRRNATRSTGPRTGAGKAAAKMNAVAHGLRALSPVLPGEAASDWDAHRSAVAAALGPVGALEAELADRVALLTWRLRRVVQYEAAVTSAEQDHAGRRARDGDGGGDAHPAPPGGAPRTPAPRALAAVQADAEAARAEAERAAGRRDQMRRLPTAPPDLALDGGEAYEVLALCGGCAGRDGRKPVDLFGPDLTAATGAPDDPATYAWTGWTAASVLAGVDVIARASKLTAAALLERATLAADETAEASARRAERLGAERTAREAAAASAERAARAQAVLPSGAVLERVMRYESHLNKQLVQTLHLLERLQAPRDGPAPVPPRALGVTVETGAPAARPAD